MRALFVILGAVVILMSLATQPASAGKGTHFDQFVKRLKKFADDDYALTPKGFCVCQDGSCRDQLHRLSPQW